MLIVFYNLKPFITVFGIQQDARLQLIWHYYFYPSAKCIRNHNNYGPFRLKHLPHYHYFHIPYM